MTMSPCFNVGTNLLDVSQEQFDCAIEHAGRGQTIATERPDESRGLPIPMRYSINDTVTARCSTVEPGHVRLGPGFVDEDQLHPAVAASIDAFSPKECSNYFAAAGYEPE